MEVSGPILDAARYCEIAVSRSAQLQYLAMLMVKAIKLKMHEN